MLRNSGSLDANVLLRLLLNDMPQQHRAAEALLEKKDASYDVADSAVIEVVFALERHYQFSRHQIGEAMYSLMSLIQINCNRNLFTTVLPHYIEHPSLSFEDCCLAVYAQLNQAIPLWTFDRKLANQSSHARLVPAVK